MVTFERLQETMGTLPSPTLMPKEDIHCLDVDESARRYYTRKAMTERTEVFPGVTDVIHQSHGDVGRLINWYYTQGVKTAIMGEVESNSGIVTKEDMLFGSFFHGLHVDLVSLGCQYSPDHIQSAISDFWIYHGCRFDMTVWEKRTKRTIIAYLDWVEKEGIEFLAVELPVILREYDGQPFGVGSRIDIVCLNKDGELWLVDLKTGEGKSYKGFPPYQYQLGFYKRMLLANYPQFADEPIRLFNLSPKKWNKTSRKYYTLEEQEDPPTWLLSFLCQKYYYEKGDAFLNTSYLRFSDDTFSLGCHTHEHVTYYDLIQEHLKKLEEEQTDEVQKNLC